MPIATDTAFAVALIVMLGRRVPVELRVFLTAAVIVDDIGAIVVVALFYSGELHWGYLAARRARSWACWRCSTAPACTGRCRTSLLGVALWVFVHEGGLHATLAGVLLALLIPTRPPANLNALLAQADAVITAETTRGHEALRHGPSAPALRTLDAIHDRIESPADRTLRAIEPWSSYRGAADLRAGECGRGAVARTCSPDTRR